MPRLTRQALMDALRYDPVTGSWTRLQSCRSDLVGKPAGGVCGDGYVWIRVGGGRYKSHRLAFFYMTGRWPRREVDHKNTNRTDARWGNIRHATRRQNQANVAVRADNVSGLKGVTLLRRTGRFQARIVLDNGRREFIGLFKTAPEANAAYRSRAAEVFGEYARGQ